MALGATGTGLHPQPPAGAAGTALLVPSLVSGAEFAVIELRPGRHRARLSLSSPVALSGSVVPARRPCARQPGRLPSLGPPGSSYPPGPGLFYPGASLDSLGAVTSAGRLPERLLAPSASLACGDWYTGRSVPGSRLLARPRAERARPIFSGCLGSEDHLGQPLCCRSARPRGASAPILVLQKIEGALARRTPLLGVEL